MNEHSEEKAMDCLDIARLMLPGADDDAIEKQAIDLMHIPHGSVRNMKARMKALAMKLAAEERPARPRTRYDMLKRKGRDGKI